MPDRTAYGALTLRLDATPDQVVREVSAGRIVAEMRWAEVIDAGARLVATAQARTPPATAACIGICADTSLEGVAAIAGCVATGTRFTVLPSLRPGSSVERYLATCRAKMDVAGVTHLLAHPRLVPVAHDLPAPVETLTLATSGGGTPYGLMLDEAAMRSLRIVQFTSGTTGAPRAVEVRHDQLMANVHAISTRRQLDPGESFVTWLPISHDMGLVGLVLMPLLLGGDLTVTSPFDFLRSPSSWIDALDSFRGTFSAAPSFAYGLIARRTRGGAWDLSSVRTLVNAGERVDVADAHAFLEAFRAHQLAPTSLAGCYGMAENTLGVTAPDCDDGLEDITMPDDRASDAEIRVRHALLGRPLAGTEVALDATGDGDGALGEVLVAGTSLVAGYLGGDAPLETRTSRWLRTGDVGGMVNGTLFVTGRLGDLLNVRGRKFPADELERVAASVPGVRLGHVAAVSTQSHPLCVVIEVADDAPRDLPKQVARLVVAALGVRPEVVEVEPAFLPRTTSGKLQRGQVRDWLEGASSVPTGDGGT